MSDRIYMSCLTTPGFTATQYTLLSSLFALPGRLLASQSGWIVEAGAEAAGPGASWRHWRCFSPDCRSVATARVPMQLPLAPAILIFYLYSSLLGVAGIVLTICIARR